MSSIVPLLWTNWYLAVLIIWPQSEGSGTGFPGVLISDSNSDLLISHLHDSDFSLADFLSLVRLLATHSVNDSSNPRRACARVTVVALLCVCPSVPL